MNQPADTLAKLAARYRIPKGQEGKFFVREGNQDSVERAARSSEASRKLTKAWHKGFRDVPQHVKKKNKEVTSEGRQFLRSMRRPKADGPESSTRGTVVRDRFLPKDQQSKKFSRGRVVLNDAHKKKMKAVDRLNRKRTKQGKKPISSFGRGGTRRQLLAHEAFHVKAPKGLRDSETLAHAYGGFKGTKGSLAAKGKAAIEQIAHYKASRRGDGSVGLNKMKARLGMHDRGVRRDVNKIMGHKSKSTAQKLVQRARIAAKKRARARKARKA